MGLEEAMKVKEQITKEQKDHEWYMANHPVNSYDFSVDEYNSEDFPNFTFHESQKFIVDSSFRQGSILQVWHWWKKCWFVQSSEILNQIILIDH